MLTYQNTAINADGTFDCSAEMPGVASPIALWAPGDGVFTFPPEAALRLGANKGANSTGQRFAVLQMHYNNPAGVAGVRDSSGFKLRTRPYSAQVQDAGWAILGASVSALSLPAGRPAIGVRTICLTGSIFTTTQLPAPSSLFAGAGAQYTVIANALHMHTLGSRIWHQFHSAATNFSRLIVNGTDPLGNIAQWNFNEQTIAPTSVKWSLGDAFVFTAIYNTTRANGLAKGNPNAAAGLTVPGCETTSCEMGLAFLLYYPRAPNWQGCTLTPSFVCDDSLLSSSTTCASLS